MAHAGMARPTRRVAGVVNKTVIVTGATGGIGSAVARSFAGQNARIVLVDLDVSDSSFVDELSALGAAGVASIGLDVADPDASDRVVAVAMQAFGSIEVIVNVAGLMIYKPLAEVTAADWDRLLSVNLVGAAMLTGAALRTMKPGGAVINIASVHARRTTPLVAPYAAAKAALLSLTRSAAIEGKPLGIRVNAILPGAIDTPMLRNSPTIRSGEEVLSPEDVGSPEDVAALTLFLASDEARFITGEDVVADGGRMGRL